MNLKGGGQRRHDQYALVFQAGLASGLGSCGEKLVNGVDGLSDGVDVPAALHRLKDELHEPPIAEFTPPNDSVSTVHP
jgi:hypothetical protein